MLMTIIAVSHVLDNVLIYGCSSIYTSNDYLIFYNLYLSFHFSFTNSSPCGKKFRSKPQVQDFLKGKVDLRNFDFRTGTMTNGIIRNSSRKRKADVFTRDFAAAGISPTKIPLRQTAIKFTRQPVTVINNSPIYVSGVDKKFDSKSNAGQQPRPIFWEKCLQDLHVVDENDNNLDEYELPSLFRPVGPKKEWGSLVNTLTTDLYLSKKNISGQNMSLKAFEKNPCIWLNAAQPLCAPFKVCDSDIRRQEERVQYVRKRLADAIEEYDYLKSKTLGMES
jgi:methyl-CpG-binding domain protein 2